MSRRMKASLLMVLSAMSFSAMQIVIAKSAAGIPLFEQLFFRNLFAAGGAYISVRKQGHRLMGKPENRRLLVLRSLMGYLGMICLFYASAHGAQGDVAVMNKMSPFIVTLLAVVFLREKVARYQVAALLLALAGAVVVSDPTFQSEAFPIFVALLSALFSGIAYTMVGALKGREAPSVVVFFFSICSTLISMAVMAPGFVVPTGEQLLLLVLIGLFALGGQVALTWSYAMANASEVSIFNYSGIVFSMLFSGLFLGERLKASSVAGGILVVLAGVITLIGQERSEGTDGGNGYSKYA